MNPKMGFSSVPLSIQQGTSLHPVRTDGYGDWELVSVVVLKNQIRKVSLIMILIFDNISAFLLIIIADNLKLTHHAYITS